MPLGVSAIRSMVGKSSMTLFTEDAGQDTQPALLACHASAATYSNQWSDLSDTASPCRARTAREMRVARVPLEKCEFVLDLILETVPIPSIVTSRLLSNPR